MAFLWPIKMIQHLIFYKLHPEMLLVPIIEFMSQVRIRHKLTILIQVSYSVYAI